MHAPHVLLMISEATKTISFTIIIVHNFLLQLFVRGYAALPPEYTSCMQTGIRDSQTMRLHVGVKVSWEWNEQVLLILYVYLAQSESAL